MNIFPKSLLSALAVCFLCATAAFAIDPGRAMSQYVRERWGTERGFPRGAIHAITQTADGYLWIGTEQGLVRFDGVQFRLIHRQSDLGSLGGVLGLAPGQNGDLWIRLQNLTLFLYHEGRIYDPLSRAGPKSTIFSISSGRNGAMIAAHGQQGVYTFSTDRLKGDYLKQVAPARGLPRSPVLTVAQTGDGHYWLGTRGGGLFELHEGATTQFLKDLPDPKVNCLLPDGEKNLWVGTDSGIALWNGSELSKREAPPELKPYQILALAKDRDRNLWVGTDTGDVFRLNAKGLQALDPGRKEPGFAITAFFEDREGSIWIGSGNGLERLRDSAFVTYSVPEGVPTDGSNPVFVDGQNRMWFAPVTGGLWWWKDGLHGSVASPELNGDIVYSIAGAPDGLWLGRQRGGITHLTESGASYSTQTLTVKEGLAQNSIYTVYRDHEGNVWAGTLSGGVGKWDGTRFRTFTNAQGLASNTVTSILQTERGMWFATPNGLSLLSQGSWKTFRVPEGLPSENVNCLLQDKAGTLWVGTNAGLAFWKDGRFSSAAHAKGALRDQVLDLAQDAYGWLWISTSNHVLRVRKDALLNDNLSDASVVEYGLADGLRGLEGVKRQHSVWEDGRGRIWFSLNRGISMVDPSRLRGSSEPALPKLQFVTADGAELPTSRDLQIPAGKKRMVFSYAGLSLSVPDRVRFRYKLDGFDRDWSKPSPDRQAEYTNLGPGRYRFHVVASNPDGVWSGTEASLAFSVDPAFWQTWWFQLGIVLTAAGAVAAAYRFRLRQLTGSLNLRFEERLTERTRIAQELHDTLLQGFLSASMQLHVAAERIPAESPVKASVLKTLELMKRVTEEGRNAVRGLRAERSAPLLLEEAFSRIATELPAGPCCHFSRGIARARKQPCIPCCAMKCIASAGKLFSMRSTTRMPKRLKRSWRFLRTGFA